MTVVLAVWAWLKKWWKMLLFPLGILVWLVGRASAKRTVVLQSPALTEAEAFRNEVVSETAGKLKEAEAARDAELRRVEAVKSAQLEALDRAAAEHAKRLEGKPEELNDFLKNVGREVRAQQRKP